MYAGRIYADFQNLDDENRVRLTTAGSAKDLAAFGEITPGMTIGLYTDDADDQGNADPLLAEGAVETGVGDERVVRVDRATIRHASDDLGILRKRFFDTAIGDVLRALDGGALIGATTLGMCVIDHVGFLSTGRGQTEDFKAVVTKYLAPINPGYDPDWLWEVRNGLAHAHGASAKVRSGKQPLGVAFTHLHPECHLRDFPDGRWLNVESFIADVIAASWQAFDAFRTSPEQPLHASRDLLIVWQSNAAANKPYGEMHRWLTQLDWVPLQREWLANDIRKGLRDRTEVGRLSA